MSSRQGKKGPRDLKIRRTLKGANHCRVPRSTSQQSHKAYNNYRLLNVPAEKRSYEQPHQRLRSKTPHSPFSRTSIRAGPCADTTLRNALGTTSVIVVLFILSVNSEPIFAFIFLICIGGDLRGSEVQNPIFTACQKSDPQKITPRSGYFIFTIRIFHNGG